MSVDRLAQELQQLLLRRIQEDQLILPTFPAVAARVLEILRDGNAGTKETAEVLERDPVLAARALRVATSAAFAAGSRKVTLREALARIGNKGLRALLVEASAQRLFVSRNPQINDQLRLLWEHSVAVGMLARDIVAFTGGPEPESAYLAGLLHDVGKPVAATILLEVERQLTEVHQRSWIDSGDWLEVVGLVHRPIGVALAARWQLPEEVTASIRDCGEYDKSERGSYANAVCFGNAVAKKAGLAAGKVDPDDADALVMIGRSVIGINDDLLRTLSKGLRERTAGLFD